MILIKNTTIVTQNSERQILKNGAILIAGDKIAAVGQSAKLEKKYAKLKKKIIDGQVGSIDIGKQADIVIINFNQPHLKSCFETVSHLVYSARGADVEIVLVNGQVLYQK